MIGLTLARARFVLEDSLSAEGFDTGESWNGWACPVFTRAQLDGLIAALRSAGLSVEFRERQGVVVVHDAASGAPPEEFPACTFPGMKGNVWAVGAHCWTWTRVDA